jgi:hypothetical protein
MFLIQDILVLLQGIPWPFERGGTRLREDFACPEPEIRPPQDRLIRCPDKRRYVRGLRRQCRRTRPAPTWRLRCLESFRGKESPSPFSPWPSSPPPRPTPQAYRTGVKSPLSSTRSGNGSPTYCLAQPGRGRPSQLFHGELTRNRDSALIPMVGRALPLPLPSLVLKVLLAWITASASSWDLQGGRAHRQYPRPLKHEVGILSAEVLRSFSSRAEYERMSRP